MVLPKITTTKKAQSALEFLTTYGWAFLVILIMIGALSYFGVLDPSRFLPDKCIFSVGIGACTDFGALSDRLQGFIVNNFGKDVVINGGNVTVTGLATTCSPASNAIPITVGSTYSATINGVSWPSSAVANFSIPCTVAAGERATARFTVQVTPVGSTYAKMLTGEFAVKRN